MVLPQLKSVSNACLRLHMTTSASRSGPQYCRQRQSSRNSHRGRYKAVLHHMVTIRLAPPRGECWKSAWPLDSPAVAAAFRTVSAAHMTPRVGVDDIRALVYKLLGRGGQRDAATLQVVHHPDVPVV
eukprot:CAMPEP_0183363658 /NCGR_PEP_ID=MMETSP0164_2-20130417/76275_1 /TAXON_ID=221442 /ORGANISM="Coccolithus pelagicus ssp braarudi, Strain PLY182g" /LENGTH=126 /DNA_ID=CAMNT_0025538807 /DNA_START=129 /DNA_END=510 /DNA_ORIENTATION=-